jgi:hypothetical protein
MTEAIQTIRAMTPEAFWSHSARLRRRAVEALRRSVLARVRRRRLTTLRVSDAWLREYETAEAKRQDEAG